MHKEVVQLEKFIGEVQGDCPVKEIGLRSQGIGIDVSVEFLQYMINATKTEINKPSKTFLNKNKIRT